MDAGRKERHLLGLFMRGAVRCGVVGRYQLNRPMWEVFHPKIVAEFNLCLISGFASSG